MAVAVAVAATVEADEDVVEAAVVEAAVVEATVARTQHLSATVAVGRDDFFSRHWKSASLSDLGRGS